MDHPSTPSSLAESSWHNDGGSGNAGGVRRPSTTEENDLASLLLGLASGGGGSTVDGSGGDANDAVPSMSSSSPRPSVVQNIERATTRTLKNRDDDAGHVVSQESGGRVEGNNITSLLRVIPIVFSQPQPTSV